MGVLLLLRSLQKSLSFLLWTLLLIFILVVVCALILSQTVSEYIESDTLAASERIAVHDRFGTLTRCIVTMFEMTLGNFGPPTWLLMNNIDEWYGPPMILYKMTMGF